MNISQREVEEIVVLDLSGRLTAGDESAQLREKILEDVSAGHSQFLLNLKNLDFIDSTGLGTLVICYTKLQQKGGALKLVNLSRRHIELLVLTKLTTIFEVFNDEQTAINSFFPSREVKKFDILDFVKNQENS